MKRNVLQLVNSFNQGGSERQAVQLTHLLKESGRFNVHLACLDGSGVLRPEVDRLGFSDVPEYRLTSFYNRQAVQQTFRCARFLREQKIDVVHTSDFYSNVFGMAAATIAGVPARVASRRETTGFRTETQKRVERGIYRLAHSIVANADAVKRQLAAEGVNPGKVCTIYNGLDLDRIAPPATLRREEALALFGLPRGEECRFVTIVANLRHPVKDHQMFLRAARRVYAALPEARFVVAGEGELTEPTRAFAEQLGLVDRVFFLGRCEQVAELLFASDVCVLSSKAEGFSNSILEYMAAARPVVATNVGGAAEAIVDGETGYLVRSGDDEAMADRIVALLRDPAAAREMGRRGRRLVETRFSCEAQLKHTEDLYDRLLANA